MERPDHKSIFVLVCFMCFWAAASFYYFIHIPATEEAAEMELERNRLEREIIDIENFSNKHRDIRTYSAEISKQQTTLDRALPDNLKESTVIMLLQQHALSHQIHVLSITPGQRKEDSGLTILPLQLQLECDYFQLLDFLQAIQEDDRFLQISRLDVHSVDDRISFEIEFLAYAMSEKTNEMPPETTAIPSQ